MLKYGEINPLNVHGLRQVDHCPPHFSKVPFESRVPDKEITDWIWENLEGRFFLGDGYEESQANSVSAFKLAAFEIAGEASFFALNLSQINSLSTK